MEAPEIDLLTFIANLLSIVKFRNGERVIDIFLSSVIT